MCNPEVIATNPAKAARGLNAAIIGAGKLAQGICNAAQRNGYFHNNKLVMGSRRLQGEETRYLNELPNSPVVSIEQALQECDVVVLAIPTE